MPTIHHHTIHLSSAISTFLANVENSPEEKNSLLSTMLQVAVPLRMRELRQVGPTARRLQLERLRNSDLPYRLEYVLHRGPKEGDSARAFNDLATAIALLSFAPGGVSTFGTRYQWRNSNGEAV